MDLVKSVITFILVTLVAILLLEHREDRRDTARFALQSMLQCGLEAEREFNRQSLAFTLALAPARVETGSDVASACWNEEVWAEYKGLMQTAGLLATDAPEDLRLDDAYKVFLKQVTLFMQAELQRKATSEHYPTTTGAQPSSGEVDRHMGLLPVMISMRSLIAAHKEAILKAAIEGS